MRKMHIFLIVVIVIELIAAVYFHKQKVRECEEWAERTGYFLVDPCTNVRWFYEKGH